MTNKLVENQKLCKVCGLPVASYCTKNYHKACGLQKEKRFCIVCTKEFTTNIKNESLSCKVCSQKKTFLEKYGVDNPAKVQEIKEKSKKTCLAKYGVEKPLQNKEILSKVKNTCLERYGVENYGESKEHSQKSKKTNIEKYGVEHPSQLEFFKEKSISTCQERYGVDNYSQSEDSLRKSHSNFKKYKYGNETFDSSWELAFWIWHEDHNITIKRNYKKFKYTIKGKDHFFFPDFEIEGKLYEIKGDHFFRAYVPESTQAKFDVGKKEGITFIMTKEIKPILDYITKVYGNKYLKSFKNI